jgi:alcohol dehydrogenase class IV
MLSRSPDHPALKKYASVGRLLARDTSLDDEHARAVLLDILAQWTEQLRLPRLGHFGVTRADLHDIFANSRASSMKTNPVALEDDEIARIPHFSGYRPQVSN